MCIFRYFPYGGLQKDFLRVAYECASRGHRVDIYCGENSEIPEEFVKGVAWHTIVPNGLMNHTRAKSFETKFIHMVRARKFDCILGFNRMKGLDFYFAGDVCLAESLHSRLVWQFRTLIPRYRTFLRLERYVFSPKSRTRILLITDKQKEEYRRWYATPEERFCVLPVGFDSRCGNVQCETEVRNRLRKELGVDDSGKGFAVALIGSDFKRKGADRAIRALASLPENLRQHTKLFLVGDSKPKAFLDLAVSEGVRDSVVFLGARNDVPELMHAMDLLVHPAREEAGGSVLIEAAVSRLPTICTDICGFASHVEQWELGRTVASPFIQEIFNAEFAKFVGFLMENHKPRSVFPEDLKQYRRAAAVADRLEKFVESRAG